MKNLMCAGHSLYVKDSSKKKVENALFNKVIVVGDKANSQTND